MRHLGRNTSDLQEFFSLTPHEQRWDYRLVRKGMRKVVSALRDKYMHRIYMAVTINLSHLASRLIVQLKKQGRHEIECHVFHRLLYLAVKYIQAEERVHLHRGLRNPQAYHDLLEGTCEGLTQFMEAAEDTGLVETVSGVYRLLEKVHAPQDFDDVRRENPVAVYANESTPVAAVARVIDRVTQPATEPSMAAIARMRFDDELLAWRWDKAAFSKERHRHINEQETATKSGEPYLLVPPGHRSLGVVMVHGFLASPAELRGYGEQLAAAGHPVIGVRLKGHGTSPWDLRERHWREWLASVRRGYSIMSAFVDRIALVGFSTGGALALLLAAEAPAGLAGVAAVAVPLGFRKKTMVFVPLVHTANTILKWLSAEERAFPFRVNRSQQPDVNYRHIPIRALNELRHAIDHLEGCLPEVRCPVLVLQGTGDNVVTANSAERLQKRLGSQRKHMHMVQADRHHILSEDVAETRALINDFLASLSV
jgi:esterase/lipase